MKIERIFLFVLASMALSHSAFSAEELEAEASTVVASDELGEFRTRKFLNLTLGIEQDEKLPPLPEKIDFKGDFRKIVSVSYNPDINTIRFNPKTAGFGTLTVHDKRNGKLLLEFRIDIKKSRLDKVVREIRALLGDIEGINIKIVNNKVVVDGQILLPRDMARIYNVIRQFDNQAASLVTLSPLAQKKIAEYISRDINNPEIEVRSVNEKIILQGFATEEDSKRAEIIAKSYLPDIVIDAAEDGGPIKKRKPANDGVINLIQLKIAAPKAPAKLLQVVVHFVELSKDYSKYFKFNFSPSLSDNSQMTFDSGGERPGGVVSSITGVISNLLPSLNWAKQHGHARILESTSLIIEDGHKGEIRQVTDMPYPVISKDGTQGTAFASVGITTSIKPTISDEKSNSVNMELSFEISSLIGNSPTGAPIVSKNQMASVVTVRDRQSAAVGGLIRASASTGYNRPSGVKNPIISLYASKDFVKQQSQFVVFVTPIVKTSASSGSEQIKKKFRLRD